MDSETSTTGKDLGGFALRAGKSESLNDAVYRILKNEILLCRLAPGAEVSEGLLVERYGFSKAPTRSALTRLRQDRLVASRGRLGNVVTPITIQDVHEVFHLRLLLEVEATRLAAGRIDPETLMRADAEVRRHHHAAHHGSSTDEAYREANHAFHRLIVEASGNQRLAELVISLIEQHERIVHYSLSLQNRDIEFHHIHDNLVKALLDGDGAAAAEIARKAIRGSQDKILEALVSSDLPARISPAG